MEYRSSSHTREVTVTIQGSPKVKNKWLIDDCI
jgi:hypothetical protein